MLRHYVIKHPYYPSHCKWRCLRLVLNHGSHRPWKVPEKASCPWMNSLWKLKNCGISVKSPWIFLKAPWIKITFVIKTKCFAQRKDWKHSSTQIFLVVMKVCFLMFSMFPEWLIFRYLKYPSNRAFQGEGVAIRNLPSTYEFERSLNKNNLNTNFLGRHESTFSYDFNVPGIVYFALFEVP